MIKLIIFVLFLTFQYSTSKASAQDNQYKDDKYILNINWENDAFSGDESGYTNGTRISYISSEKYVPKFIKTTSDYLPMLSKSGKKRMSLAIGQSIFTPYRVNEIPPSANDRPYAGWAYGSFGIFSDTRKSLDNLTLTLGVVGPSAKGRQAQNEVHSVIAAQPKGWDYQLEDEFGAVVSYSKKWHNITTISDSGMQTEIMPSIGTNLGNIFTDASAGVTFRLGYDLKSDYGVSKITPGFSGSEFFRPSTKSLTWYLFSSFEFKAVKRNIFLDGNTNKQSRRVRKEKGVGMMHFGFAINYDDWRLSYSQVYMTQEYDPQPGGGDKYGIITASRRF